MKHNNDTPADIPLTQRITLRLRPDEYDRLSALADAAGENVSQTARRLLFKKRGGASALSEGDEKKQRLAALTGIHAALKKTAKDFGCFVASYERAVNGTDASGRPMVNTGQTIYIVRSLETLMLETQKQINEAMTEAGWSTVHVVARSPALAKIDEKKAGGKKDEAVAGKPKEEISKYSYMQKVMIVGNLAYDAKVYQSQKGAEMMRLAVVCDDNFGQEKGSTTYTVFAKKTGVLEFLHKGRQVMVSGTQRVKLGKDEKGAPAVEVSVYADDITLGRD